MAKKQTAKVPELYTRIKREIAGDAGACAVVALAAVTGLSGKTIQEALSAEGRKLRCGTTKWQQRQALQALGFKVTVHGRKEIQAIIATYPGRAKNLQNITTHHPRRFAQAWTGRPDCLMFSHGHVSAFVNGKVIDWAISRSKHVYELWTVERI